MPTRYTSCVVGRHYQNQNVKLVCKTFISLRCENVTAFILALPYFCCVSESKGRNTWDI